MELPPCALLLTGGLRAMAGGRRPRTASAPPRADGRRGRHPRAAPCSMVAREGHRSSVAPLSWWLAVSTPPVRRRCCALASRRPPRHLRAGGGLEGPRAPAPWRPGRAPARRRPAPLRPAPSAPPACQRWPAASAPPAGAGEVLRAASCPFRRPCGRIEASSVVKEEREER